MRTIWKYELLINSESILNLPLGYQILSFGNQNGKPTIWVLHEAYNPTKEVKFRLFSTGEEIDEEFDDLKFIGTAMFNTNIGNLIFHLFKIISYDYEED